MLFTPYFLRSLDNVVLMTYFLVVTTSTGDHSLLHLDHKIISCAHEKINGAHEAMSFSQDGVLT